MEPCSYAWGLNPLNQVYVFNLVKTSGKDWGTSTSLNPLNQVYVFNQQFRQQFSDWQKSQVLIP